MPTTLIIPHHVGFILDGNRRYAKLKGLMPWYGHDFGCEKVHELLDWCLEYGIKELTLYTFSMQNFYRPVQEVKKLMQLIDHELHQLLVDPRIVEHQVCVRVIGQIELLPSHIQEVIKKVETHTAAHQSFTLNICIAYGGKEEIIHAVKRIVQKTATKVIDIADITQEVFEAHLLLRSQPDLVIRTGGEQRTSNFLPWQSAYSEWFFVSKLLPEFNRNDFSHILKEFASRERRYGR